MNIPRHERLKGLSSSVVRPISFVLVIVMGVIDYLTGFEVSVTLFYLLPVSLGAWFAGRRTGLFLAAASAAVWFGADVLSRHFLQPPFVPIWNSVMVGAVFVVIAILLSELRKQNTNLEQTVLQRTESLRGEIAERVRTEQQLKDTNAALTTAREDLQRSFRHLQTAHSELQRTQSQLIEAAKMETVGRLAAGVAHEVKNPLMILSLGVDYFLQRKTGPLEEEVLAQDMKEAVRRARRIINLLLDYSRPRPLQRSHENLNQVVEDSLTLVRYPLEKSKVQVVRKFQPDLPLVRFDRTRIEHVLLNLFLNAIQAMPKGGTLTLRTSTVVPLRHSNGSTPDVRLLVEDTGCGIPENNLDKLFEPFFTTKPPGQGTGLGLSIARKILQSHGATIALTNRPEGGARAALQFDTQSNGPA